MTLLIILALFVSGAGGCAPGLFTHAEEPVPVAASAPSVPQYQVSVSSDLCALSATVASEPTGVLTLRTALSQALVKNQTLEAYSWEVRAKEARMLQTSRFPNPELGVEIENFGGSGATKSFDAAESTVQLSQLVELGGKRFHRGKTAALERDVAAWDYEAKRFDVLTGTTLAFIEVLALQEQIRLAGETLRLAEQVLDTVRKRIQAGKVSPLEETKASVNLTISQISEQTARRNLNAARQRLASWWGSGSPGFEEARGDLQTLAAIPPLESLQRLLHQNPEIARRDAELQQARTAVELEKANRIPDVTLSGGVRQFAESDDHALVVGIGLPLPLFDRNQGGIQEARANLAKAQAERKAVEVNLNAELVEAYQALAASHAEASALRDQVLPSAQQAFSSAQLGYQEGKFGFLDVLDAQRTLFEVKGQYVETVARFQKEKVTVDRLIGQSMDMAETASAESLKEKQL